LRDIGAVSRGADVAYRAAAAPATAVKVSIATNSGSAKQSSMNGAPPWADHSCTHVSRGANLAQHSRAARVETGGAFG
jgi:hypothetical protein